MNSERPTDPLRTRFYRAERKFWECVKGENHSSTLGELSSVVEWITAWANENVSAHIPSIVLEGSEQPRYSIALPKDNKILIAPDMLTPAVICHEMAHVIDYFEYGTDNNWHNLNFVNLYLKIVTTVFGDAATQKAKFFLDEEGVL